MVAPRCRSAKLRTVSLLEYFVLRDHGRPCTCHRRRRTRWMFSLRSERMLHPPCSHCLSTSVVLAFLCTLSSRLRCPARALLLLSSSARPCYRSCSTSEDNSCVRVGRRGPCVSGCVLTLMRKYLPSGRWLRCSVVGLHN